jgi:CO/xanthine dehydrogenase FAD-binding subunit
MSSREESPGVMEKCAGFVRRRHISVPDPLIDVTAQPMTEIRVGRDSTSVGALVSNTDFAGHHGIIERFPALSQAILSGAPGLVSDMAAHPSDFAVALTIFDARIVAMGQHGSREIPIADFYPVPGDPPETENALGWNELIFGIKLPHTHLSQRSLFWKVRGRQSDDFDLSSVAVAIDLRCGVIRDIRIALGGVASIPWRAHGAEEMLVGRRPNAGLFHLAARTALWDARSFRDNGDKQAVAERTVAGTLWETVDRA